MNELIVMITLILFRLVLPFGLILLIGEKLNSRRRSRPS
jgi:hypothetical protein